MNLNQEKRISLLILFGILFISGHSQNLIAQEKNTIPVYNDNLENNLLPKSFHFKTNTAYAVRKRLIDSSSYFIRNSVLSPVDSITFKYQNSDDSLWTSKVKYEWEDNHWIAKWRFTYERDENGQLQGWFRETSHNSGWVYSYRQLYRISRGKIVLSISQSWEEEKWNSYRKMEYTFDKNKRLRSWVSSYWAENRWYKEFRKYTHFNAAGYKDSIIWQVHTGRPWYGSSMELIRYDNKGNRISDIYYISNIGQWISRERNTYKYNSDNKRIWRLFQRWSNDHSFFSTVNEHQYKYDSSLNLISELRSRHDSLGWHREMLDTYQYDQNNNLIMHQNQEFRDSAWNNLWRKKYSYNQYNVLIEEIYEDWDDMHWEPVWRKVKKYDNDGYLVSRRQEIWKDSSWNIVGIQHYYYDTMTGTTSSILLPKREIQVYPNPCREYIWFQIPGKSTEPYELRIYQIEGTEIRQIRSRANIISCDMQNVPAGVYLYDIQHGYQHYSGYFIKQ